MKQLITTLLLITSYQLSSAVNPIEAIHDAARTGDIPELERLLKKKPRLINSINNDSGCTRTPLFTAIIALQPEAVKVLLAHGAQVKTVSTLHNNALHLLADSHTSPSSGDEKVTKIAELLINAGVPVNQTNHRNQTPLQLAMLADNFPLIKQLIKIGGIDCNQKDPENGQTLLMQAIHRQSRPTSSLPVHVLMLLLLGADTNILAQINGVSCYALDVATEHRHYNNIRLLLAANAPLHDRSICILANAFHGELIFMLACHQIHNNNTIPDMLNMPDPKTFEATRLAEQLSLEQIEALQPLIDAEKKHIYQNPDYRALCIRARLRDNNLTDPVGRIQAQRRGVRYQPPRQQPSVQPALQTVPHRTCALL